MLARWSRNVPPDHVHVITVPKIADPPDLLWRRFSGVVGIDPDAYDISNAFVNTSLGPAEAEFLRRLNVALGDEVGWPLYDEVVKHKLAQDVLAKRPKKGRMVLQPDDAAWVADRANATVETLATAGYDIVGTLDDLRPPPGDEAAPARVELRTGELDLAVDVAVALLVEMSKQRGSLKAVETLVRALAVTSPPDPAPIRQRHRGVAG